MIDPVLEQLHRRAVPEDVRADALADGGSSGRLVMSSLLLLR
jgi:hypothetical protein